MNQNDTPKNLFNLYGAVHFKDVFSPEIAKFLTNLLLFKSSIEPKGDPQVPNAKTIMNHNFVTDSILEQLWPLIETAIGEEIIPTYGYSRLYSNGDLLEKHIDKPPCEISVTIQLGRSHHYSWPIYIGGRRFDLAEGDAILYKGCDIEHWRNICDGPENYYSGQIFLHYVRANGPYVNEAGDRRWDILPFVRNRGFLMEQK